MSRWRARGRRLVPAARLPVAGRANSSKEGWPRAAVLPSAGVGGDWPGSAVTVSQAGRVVGECRDPGIKAACVALPAQDHPGMVWAMLLHTKPA